MDGLVNKVYEFGHGKVREHLGGIYDFLQAKDLENLHDIEKKSEPEKTSQTQKNTETPTVHEPATTRKLSYSEQKERARMISKAEKQVKSSENKIAELETEVKALELKLSGGDSSSETLAAYDAATKRLETEMSVWELAQIELEDLQNK